MAAKKTARKKKAARKKKPVNRGLMNQNQRKQLDALEPKRKRR